MTTKSKRMTLEFQDLGRRKVVADFSAGQVSSDGGGLLLREEGKRYERPPVAADRADGQLFS